MEKKLLNPARIRKIKGGFSFIPHQFVLGGFINELNKGELLLYLFLILVSDSQGLSFYSDKKICEMLKVSSQELDIDRAELIKMDLVAYAPPFYQVLELPDFPLERTFNPIKENSFFHLREKLER